MTYAVGLLIGATVGAATGYAAERVPLPPLIQSIGAAITGGILASIACAAAWLLRPPPDAGVAAVSFGLVEFGVTSLLLGVGAGVLHAALAWAGEAIAPAVAAHRGVITGLLGGVYSALAFIVGLGSFRPLR